MTQADKVPPHSIQAEESILGAMLLDAESVETATGILKPSDFYRREHQALFAAMLALKRKGKPVDLVTMMDEMGDAIEDSGGVGYLADLQAAIPTTAHVEHYAKSVKDKAGLRALRSALADAHAKVFEQGATSDGVLSQALGALNGIETGIGSDNVESIGEVFSRHVSEMQALADAGDGATPRPKSGFHDLDNRITLGGMVVLAARPAIGKSALAWCIARNVAMQGFPVLFFLQEMTKEQMAARALSAETGIPYGRQSAGRLFESEWGGVYAAMGKYADLPLYLHDETGITPERMESICNRHIAKTRQPLGLVVVDYLTLLDSGNPRHGETEAATTISKALKRLGDRLGCPMLVVSQLSRNTEKRDNKRPMMSDLRQSGQVEQDATIVIGLYRDDYYAEQEQRESEAPGIAEVIILKNRFGQQGTVTLKFDRERTEFSDLTTEHEVAPWEVLLSAPVEVAKEDSFEFAEGESDMGRLFG